MTRKTQCVASVLLLLTLGGWQGANYKANSKEFAPASNLGSRLTTANFAWAEGSFVSSEEKQKEWIALEERANNLVLMNRADIRKRLSLESIDYNPEWSGCFGDDQCEWTRAFGAIRPMFNSWPEFQTALNNARPVFDGFEWAIRNGEAWAKTDLSTFSEAPVTDFSLELRDRTLGDQILRQVMFANDASPGDHLTEQGRVVFNMLARMAARKRDHENTIWLKSLLDKHSWDDIQSLGGQSAEAAWLIVRHSDDDPIFMARILKIVEKNITGPDSASRNNANRFDELYLDLTQKQRFGTQGHCKNETYFYPKIVSDKSVDLIRLKLKLGSISSYISKMQTFCRTGKPPQF